MVGIVVLGAGGSTRLGRSKQLLPYRGRTLLRHAVEVALAAARHPGTGESAHGGETARATVAVVLGADSALMKGELSGTGVLVVDNQRWREGMSTSLRAGLTGLLATGDPDAALFLTCDQPLVTPELLAELLRLYAATRPGIVACEYGGTVGVPALFDKALFGELRELTGDAGAKRVIEAHRSGTVTVPFPGGAVDIDTAEDVSRLGRDPLASPR